MSRPKVGATGFFILTAFILTIIAVFTQNWITYTFAYYGTTTGTGLVPYDSSEPGWLAVSSWLMFVSLGLFVPLSLIYLLAAWKVHHHGCCHALRHHFHTIGLFCSLLTILEAVAFVLTACNAGSYISLAGVKLASSQVGFSAYLALASSICTVVAMSLAGHVARHLCH